MHDHTPEGLRASSPARPDDVVTRAATLADVPAVAALHAAAIGDGFLSTLGPRFLEHLYRRTVQSPRAFLLIADRRMSAVGFLAGSEDTGAFYREFLRRDALRAGMSAAAPAARSWRKVLETLRYGTKASALPPAELLAVAVSPESRGSGAGRLLVTEFQLECRRRAIPAARVVVGAGNTAAIKLYESCGFKPATNLEVHPGTTSLALVWKA